MPKECMTYWDFFIENLNSMVGAGELRICVGFFKETLGDKELDCISQLFLFAQEIGVIARSEAESERKLSSVCLALIHAGESFTWPPMRRSSLPTAGMSTGTFGLRAGTEHHRTFGKNLDYACPE